MLYKYALLIGINYFGQSNELVGCINDVFSIKNLLIEKYNFKESNIIVMTDETEIKPTGSNILRELMRIIYLSPDVFWFHYSGHGINILDRTGTDELDGRDEGICPIDYKTTGIILDDKLNNIFKLFNEQTFIIVMFDACHSGTSLDLQYLYNIKTNEYEVQNSKVIKSNIHYISSCSDNQVSVDNDNQGILTQGIIKILNDEPNINFINLIKKLNIYTSIYNQTPIYSSSQIKDNQSINI